MKRLFTLSTICFLSLSLTACAQQTSRPFSITGDVSKVKDRVTMIHYSYVLNGIAINDSAYVKNNRYILKGNVDEHVMLQSQAVYADTSLHYDYRINYSVVHILPGTKASILHGDKFSSTTITGSPAQDEYNRVHTHLVNGESNFITEYLKENTNSPIAIFLLRQLLGPSTNISQYEPLFNDLSQKTKNTASGKKLANRFNAIRNLAIGKAAPDLSQKDSTGKVITLSSLRGKYVLVEFWASWCSPCRRENPDLVKLYDRYKTQKFEIFGISIDENRKSWLNAVKKDKLPWINTADLLDENKNPAALAYAVVSVPFNILVNPDGKIIGTALRGAELEKTLEEIFIKTD